MNFLVICEVEKLRGIDRGREKLKFENYKMRHGMKREKVLKTTLPENLLL